MSLARKRPADFGPHGKALSIFFGATASGAEEGTF
jgi:hypothetical protein